MKRIALILAYGLLVLPGLADEPIGRDYETKLRALIQQHHPEAKVERENNRLVYRFHTLIFKNHTIHKNGHFAEEPHDEEGPNVDGVLVTVFLTGGSYRRIAVEIPQTLNRPYWETFVNVYPLSDTQHLWLSLSYGKRADRKLIDAIKTCFGPVLPPGHGAKNQNMGKEPQPADGVLTAAVFNQIKDYVLAHGDRQTYCTMLNNNPHVALGNMDIFLNPDTGQQNINCDLNLSGFNHMVIRTRKPWKYYRAQLNLKATGPDLIMQQGTKAEELKKRFQEALSEVRQKKDNPTKPMTATE